MIYQEINLPIWAQLVLMVVLIIALLLLLHIKPVKDVKQENEEITRQSCKRALRGLHSTVWQALQLRTYRQ